MKLSKKLKVFSISAVGFIGQIKMFNVNEELGEIIENLKSTTTNIVNLESILDEDFEKETIALSINDHQYDINIYSLEDYLQIVEIPNMPNILLLDIMFNSTLLSNPIIRNMSPLFASDIISEHLGIIQ
jgi:hypothetical protein